MRDAESRPAYLIEKLLAYGLDNEMITEHDVSYVRNQLLEL